MRPTNKITAWERVPLIFDLDYAAVLTDTKRSTLKYLASNGRFPAFKIGKLWKVKKEDFQEWIESQKCEQKGSAT